MQWGQHGERSRNSTVLFEQWVDVVWAAVHGSAVMGHPNEPLEHTLCNAIEANFSLASLSSQKTQLIPWSRKQRRDVTSEQHANEPKSGMPFS